MQQAITWAKFDPYLCCHMVSLGHNELTYHQIQIQNYLLVNQRAQVLPMYKNNTQQYKHTHIHKNDDKLSFMLIINARSVITTHVQDTTQAQKSATWNYNMIYMMTSHCLYDIIHNIFATIQC